MMNSIVLNTVSTELNYYFINYIKFLLICLLSDMFTICTCFIFYNIYMKTKSY